MKVLGITDEVNACDCCGKHPLKCTVVFEKADGTITYYGRTCAARNSGRTNKQIDKELKDAKESAFSAAKQEFAQSIEAQQEDEAINRCNMMKVSFAERMEILRPFMQASKIKHAEIAAKHNLQNFQF